MKPRIFDPIAPIVAGRETDFLTVQAAISQHLDLHASHWRPGTVRHHRDRLFPFLRWLGQHHHYILDHVTPAVWSQYVAYRKTVVSPTTLHHDGQVCRLFFRECVRRGWLSVSPLDGVKIATLPVTIVPTPNTLELARILKVVRTLHDPKLHRNCQYETPKERAFFTNRNMAFYMGLVASACRVGELLELTLDHVSLDALTFTFMQTKTHTGRVVPFDDAENPMYLPLLKKWLDSRPKVETNKVFINEYGEPLTYNAVFCTWRRVRTHAGLPQFCLHSLRHYSLSRLYVETGDLKAAMKAAGHTSVSTALRYQERDLGHVRDAMKKANLTEGLTTGRKRKVI